MNDNLEKILNSKWVSAGIFSAVVLTVSAILGPLVKDKGMLSLGKNAAARNSAGETKKFESGKTDLPNLYRDFVEFSGPLPIVVKQEESKKNSHGQDGPNVSSGVVVQLDCD